MQQPIKTPVLYINDLNVWFGKNHVLKNLTFAVFPRQVTSFIGPSKCGKTALVRCLNRLNDLKSDFRYTGKIHFNGVDPYSSKANVTDISQKIGMVFHKPIPFRRSIYENVAYPVRLRGIKQSSQLDTIVEECPERGAALE